MKQTSFVVEVIIKDEKPVVIVRANNGAVIRICDDSAQLATFLEEVVANLTKAPDTNSNK